MCQKHPEQLMLVNRVTVCSRGQTKGCAGLALPLCTITAWHLTTSTPPLLFWNIPQWRTPHMPSSCPLWPISTQWKIPSTKRIKSGHPHQPSTIHYNPNDIHRGKHHISAFLSHPHAVHTLSPRLWPLALTSSLRSIVLRVVQAHHHQHGWHMPWFFLSFRTQV